MARARIRSPVSLGAAGPARSLITGKVYQPKVNSALVPCHLCKTPTDAVVITDGLNADGTLRTLTFCCTAHAAATWAAALPPKIAQIPPERSVAD